MYITIHLFRDLAFAMLTALIAIYIILMNQTGSYRLPLTIMRAIPLMVIGVMPGFWLLNQIGQHSIGGFRNPVFFSGPAFIGMIALAGIVTRNSIIIVDFIQLGLLRGLSLEEAILDSVSVRLRPILLTSGAAVLGAIPITLDTVFGGMAWSLIFGLIVSTLFSLFVIPVTYNIVYANKPDHGLPENIRKKLAASLGAGAHRIVRRIGLKALMTHWIKLVAPVALFSFLAAAADRHRTPADEPAGGRRVRAGALPGSEVLAGGGRAPARAGHHGPLLPDAAGGSLRGRRALAVRARLSRWNHAVPAAFRHALIHRQRRPEIPGLGFSQDGTRTCRHAGAGRSRAGDGGPAAAGDRL